MAGVGGTGVVTIGQVLGMAAHLEGKGVVTQDATGMAQMGGATLEPHPDRVARPRRCMRRKWTSRWPTSSSPATPSSAHTRRRSRRWAGTRTFVALNTHATPTAAFVRNPDWQSPVERCTAAIADAVGADRLGTLDAEEAATRVLGASVYTNMLMLGYAWQLGRVPLSFAAHHAGHRAERRASRSGNKAAFAWGRRLAHDPAAMRSLAGTRK